ncbi:MAG: ankyrin repeat domain-containing protein [Wolbachia endosymbiont of Armadillidium vulgare]|nr:Phosphocholine transferase AnkX [Wolbachia endosymbiont of Armadillidium vulgare]OJH32380.1 Phosphocholine transferase AnkX [Wolbachia endosymbiont of Armadillidium vulgare]
MSIVFYCEEFNDCDLDNGKTPLRKKFNEIIKDLEENNSTSQGNIKLIKGCGNIEYFRAKLSDSDRLLFTRRKHNDKDAFVILEVILNHDYHKSKFLTNREKIRNIKIIDEKVPDTVEIEDAPQIRWLGNFITFSAKQEDIVERVEKFELPLVISGSAGSGKTSVALESLKRIKEKFEGGKILYITKSENLIKESKKIFECENYNQTTDELRTHTPEEIDFLSLHEFLKKIIKVEGKKPINRSKFFSWFKEICKKDKFKGYKKDGDKIFEEFTAVIGGGSLLGEDGKDRYAKLGNRQSIFPIDKRNSVYDFFEEYRKFIEGDQKYYDPNLVAYECIAEEMYNAIVVDEVQDLTESTLSLILKSLKDERKGNFLLCGDVDQVIHPSFFSLSKLKSFLYQNKCIRDQGSEVFYTLEKNYRNSEQAIELANRILHLKNYCFASEDKMIVDNAFFMKSDTKNKGNVGFVTDDKKEEIAKKVNESMNCAVLALDDESKESARQLFDTPLVFNIHEAKGLEFENVILYKFTSCKAYNEIWNIVCPDKSEGEIDNTINRIRDSYNKKDVNTSRNKDKEDKSLEKYKFYMNALYVGVTRAVSNIYIVDDKSNLLKIVEPGEEGNVNIKKEESSSEKWRDMALELIEKGNIEQAKDIAEKLSRKGEKEYAKEVMNSLKAKGCHKQDQNSDKSKHTNSVLESSKSSSQSSEHEGKEDDISKSQNKKSKHNQNKKKKAKKCNKVQEVKPQLSLNEKDSTNKSTNPQNEEHKQDLNDKKESKRLEKNKKELFLALKNGNLQKAKRLIKQGVNVNASNEEGSTPLHLAAENGYFDIVKLFLENGAKVDDRDILNRTPLHLAAENGYFDIVKLFLENGAKVDDRDILNCTPLRVAAENGYFDTAQLLLQYKAEVNTKDTSSHTPLYLAAQNGHYEVVKLLLDNGADVNAKNKKGVTCLHFAAQNGHYEIVKLLLENGAKVDARDILNCTPLRMAAKNGYFDIVKLFLENGAKVDDRDILNCTPLHLAAENGYKNVVEILLRNKANIDARNNFNCTPLLNALKEGHSEIVDLLLANPNINVGYSKASSAKKKEDKEKFLQKLSQDNELFNLIKQAAEIDENKVDELLKKIEKLLESKNKHSFKPSLNYSPDGNDENTTIKIAIKASGKVLQLLYDYAEKNIGTDTEIFKKLKHAKENSQSKRDLCNVSVSNHSTLTQSPSFDERGFSAKV